MLNLEKLSIIIAILFLTLINIEGVEGRLSSPHIAEAAEPIITDIAIEGNMRVSSELILAATRYISVGKRLSMKGLSGDLDSIRSLGYFRKVDVEIVPREKGVKLILKVKENPIISDILWEGNENISSEELQEVISTEVGRILNSQRLEEDLDNIIALYKERGYPYAQILSANWDEEGVLTIRIAEGNIESIEIIGNKRTKSYVIKQILTLKPQRVIKQEELEESIRRVYELGFFRDVEINIEPTEKKGNFKAIIGVKEKETGSIGFGIDYGTHQRFFGFIEYREDNLLGEGKKALIHLEFGSGLDGEIKFEEPRRWGSYNIFISAGAIGRITESYLEGEYKYKLEERIVSLSLGKPISEVSTISLGYEIKNVKILEADQEEGEFRPTEGQSNSLTLSYNREPRYSSRSYILTRSSGISSRSMVEGYRERISYEIAGGFLGGDFNFSKFTYELQRVTRLKVEQERRSPPPEVAYRFKYGYGTKNLPDYELYQIGERGQVIRGCFESKGERITLLNGEYRYPLDGNFQLVGFTDMGNTWNEADSDLIPPRLKLGIGLGIRYITPFDFLIRMDYGIGEARGGMLYLSIGNIF